MEWKTDQQEHNALLSFFSRLLVFVIAYMVGGIIINKYARKVEKGDEFPNKNFWKELPGYIKVNTYKWKWK